MWSKPWRISRRQFVVGAILMVVPVVVAASCQAFRILRERQAVANLRAGGAHVSYSFWEDGATKPSAAFEWARQVFGNEVVGDVEWVRLDFSGSAMDEEVLPLTHLPNLHHVGVTGNTFTDRGVRTLASISTLRGINLSNTSVTPEGIRALAACRELEVVGLSGPLVTDDVVAAVAELPNLTYLQLLKTRLSSDGLRPLASLKKLRGLDIWQAGELDEQSLQPLAGFENLVGIHTIDVPWTDDAMKLCARCSHLQLFSASPKYPNRLMVTDEGIKYLADKTELRTVWIGNSLVSDKGVQSLSKLSQLESLNLTGTEITDSSVEYLLQFPQLKELRINRTRISSPAVERLASLSKLEDLLLGPDVSIQSAQRLQRALKDCEIHVLDKNNHYVKFQ